jgi:hypothetical protein
MLVIVHPLGVVLIQINSAVFSGDEKPFWELPHLILSVPWQHLRQPAVVDAAFKRAVQFALSSCRVEA